MDLAPVQLSAEPLNSFSSLIDPARNSIIRFLLLYHYQTLKQQPSPKNRKKRKIQIRKEGKSHLR